MAGPLVLVIVVIVVGVAVALVKTLRTAKVAHRESATENSTNEAFVGTAATGPGSAAGQGSASSPRSAAGPSSAAPVSGAEPAGLVDQSVPPERASVAVATLTEGDGARARAPETGVVPLEPTQVFSKLFELALGRARPASSVSIGHAEVAEATATALEDVTVQQKYAPRRPNMLPRILSASSDDSFSRRQLAALIAQDPSLVGNVLKIANSSFYRLTPEPVESIDRAVVLLGMDGIRSVVTAALMQPIFRIGGADFPRYPEIAWEHTFRWASAAVPYNFLVEKSDPSVAELLSLLMGLSGIVIFRVAMEQYGKHTRLRPDAGVMSSLLDAHSAVVAQRIGAGWELSQATLSGLDAQCVGNAEYPTPLGRSVYFGRLVGALAVLRLNNVIDEDTARASIPVTSMPETQVERMWMRLTPKPAKR